ncbi:hypothetical protein THASP1DRAFT_18836 [Thamnocephalis sphaerospora]|uniref:Class I SAM-dependent methyltransferase n=1 Tax=Thamnocephalis sphaerospora TaxID=78915 RepID=A0A4V1IW33_9FUNG|nr:hypothetical protein THASP1DRAFT_18836 [Thamnocephalis sphaerospora]|eukprot:RKP06159.1 hypothetical protein THASP1DRAFT_18836 [Thamnocephalis sphaerospora]
MLHANVSATAILNMLRVALADALNAPDFDARLQRIKGHFFERDYDAVFSEPTYLPVYAARYVPGRALCYYRMFTRHPALLSLLARPTRIYALGAGAGSELAAFMAAAVHESVATSLVTLHTQDIADWRDVLLRIEEASRAKWGVTVDRIRCEFSQGSVLNLFARADLITAMFVMNELFTDKRQAMRLLVDSAGSFSNLKVGERTYMIYTVFDALHEHFEPIAKEDSEWYRYPKHLQYPLELNNMRYFIRLYRRK